MLIWRCGLWLADARSVFVGAARRLRRYPALGLLGFYAYSPHRDACEPAPLAVRLCAINSQPVWQKRAVSALTRSTFGFRELWVRDYLASIEILAMYRYQGIRMISRVTLSEEAINYIPALVGSDGGRVRYTPGGNLIPQREALVAPWLPRGQVLAVGDGLGAPHAHAVSTRRCRKHRLHAGVLERGPHEALGMQAPSGFREINGPSPRVRFWQLGDAWREVQSHPERRGGGGPARGDGVWEPGEV